MDERTHMRAVLVDEPGGPEQLRLGTCPRPRPGEEELLVRVKATALNRADLLQRQGNYPPPEGVSDILGLEIAGIVEEVGAGCSGWNEGDRVFGLLAGGGYAEYAVLPCGLAMPIPSSLSFEEAAAIPEVFLTAFQALYWIGRLEEGDHVLIHAGASGVGTAAIQLVKTAGAYAYVTASAPKHGTCLELGAELAVDYRSEDFASRILEETGGRGVDIIVDFVGSPYFHRNLRVLAVDGRIVLLATLGGSKVDELDLRVLFRKRAQITASTLRNRSLSYKTELTQAFRDKLLPLFVDGRLRPVIDTVFDWQDVQEAHLRMGSNLNTGKIVLRISE